MPTLDLRAELDALLAESPDVAAERARTEFDRLTDGSDRPLVLFGAGNLGRRTVDGLCQIGRPPVAITDNSATKWGTTYDGVPVISPADAADRYRHEAGFVICVAGAYQTEPYSAFPVQLRDLGCRYVASFGHLYWRYPETFLPYMMVDLPQNTLMEELAVREAYDRLADVPSQVEFVGQLTWRLHLDFDRLGDPIPGPEYIPADLFRLHQDEVYVDCGAFTGDTVESILSATGGMVRRAIAYEADPVNATRLREYVSRLPDGVRDRINVRAVAIGAARGRVRIEPTGTTTSVVGRGSVEVACVRLDDDLQGISPTFVKMDIEGAEPDALAGAEATIRRCRPRLAVCVYHAQNHLWRLPNQIAAIDPSLKLYLRPHGRNGYDLVCYALPADPPC